MDDEIKNFIKVWISVFSSLCYCYFIVSKIPKGKFRLLFLLPIFYIFILLPLSLSSFHIGAPTAFYISWLLNFKLLLFSFDQGPLSSNPPKSLITFISIASLPIKIKQNPSPQNSQKPLNSSLNLEKSLNTTKLEQNPSPQNNQNPVNSSLNLEKSLNTTKSEQNPYPQFNTTVLKLPLLLPLKALILALVIRIYDYREHLHPTIILALYCFHLYLGIEITLAMGAALARVMLVGIELEPQFNEPYLTTSLQDFWGRRWNLMVTNILRPTVYDPIRRIYTHIFVRKWTPLPAMFAVFTVSGLMHELIYFYMTRVAPTWEVTWFFVLHGICLAIEIEVKKALTGKFRLHPVISGPLTIGFLLVTADWLFFPQLLRNGVDVKAIKEYGVMVDFIREKIGSLKTYFML